MIASTSVFVSCQDYQDEFKDLQDQINEEHPALNNQVAALEKEIADLEATVATLQAQHDKDIQTLKDADKALEDLLSDEIVKANAYALAQAEKALADAKAYADAAATQAAEQALKDAQAYADKVAAAEAQKEAQAALLAANEQAQALYNDAIAQLNKAVDAINAQIATEKSERQAADAALQAAVNDLDAAYKAADAEIWTALNKAQKDIEAAQAAADKAQATADEALKLAKANEKAIAAEVERATKAEADLKAALDEEAARAKAEEAKIWEAIAEANAKIAANAERIEEVYSELNKKIDAAVDRIKTLENKVATLQEEMKAAQEKLNDHETRILALEAWTAAYEPIIKDLQSRMATAETKIADLYTKLAAEEAARIAADKDLQDQITANANAIAQEILDRVAADKKLQDQIDANKADIAANKKAIEALQAECKKIWAAIEEEVAARIAADDNLKSLIEAEVKAREAADKAEAAAREAADKALSKAIDDAVKSLQGQIDDLVTAVSGLQDQIDDLDEKVEGYYTEICDRLTADEKKIAGALENPFEVISEVDFQAAYGPVYSYEYYPAFSVEVAGEKFEEDNRIVEGSFEQEAGKVYVLLAPQGNNFAGHQIYVKDEKNNDYPGFEFGTAQPAVYPEDVYFNAAWGWVTRGEEAGETVTGPIWMADITCADPSEEELLANIPVEMPIRPRVAAEDTKAPEFGLVPRYSVIGEYTQKNADLKDVKLLVWDENFDFWMTPASYNPEAADILNEEDLDFATTADVFDVDVDFTGADNDLIYKQMVICDSAYNECDELDAAAAEYMNGLDEKFGEWVESAELEDFTVTVADEYANYTFFYTWYVIDLSGNVYILSDEAQIVPEFEETVEATFNFEVTPESADIQITDVLTESVEGIDITTLGWCKYVPDCQNVTVEFAPVKAAPEESLVFNLKDVKDYVAPAAKETATCTKEEVDAVAGLGITYDPAKLVVDEPYEYTVTVKYGDEVISVSTINIIMRRPEGHDIELIKITSAWNPEKTQTIVWAQGYDATEDNLSDAWYLLKGSFTNIMDYVEPIDSCGCTLVFKDKTDYTDAAEYTVVTMPEGANGFQMDVPAVAVNTNTYWPLDFDNIDYWYTLAYGTNVYGLESLYGGENEFKIAYASPIYYDGVTYDWKSGQYVGGCYMKEDCFLIEFPRKEYIINETNFVGSNDPSTSIKDAIKYFGATTDYATWEADRMAAYAANDVVTADMLNYRDARILKTEIALDENVPASVKKALADKYADGKEEVFVWNDPTNEYLFEVKPEINEEKGGIYFKTYNEFPSLQSIPAYYYNFTVTDIWGCVKKYPFVIMVNPNVPL